MRTEKMMVRNVVMVMLFVTVIAPIILYTDRLGSFQASSSSCKFVHLFLIIIVILDNKKMAENWIVLLKPMPFSAARDEFVEDVTAFVSCLASWNSGSFKLMHFFED